MAVKKADLLKEAEELGIEVNDEMTVPQLKAAIAEVKGDDPEEEEKPERPYYEEWYCRIKEGKAEKLKLERKRVLISDEQAAILNEGRIKGPNSHALCYFKPEGE